MVTFHKKETVCLDANGNSVYYCEGACMASDTKPTAGNIYNGSLLHEIDTGKDFRYDAEGGDWIDPTAEST